MTDDLKDINLPEHATFLHPTAVLFNGGVLKANALADRLMDVLNLWLLGEQAPEARLLAGADFFDFSGCTRRRLLRFCPQRAKGVRIKGGTAAAYLCRH